MMNYGLLNPASLLLGLTAWICPIISLAKGTNDEYKSCHIFSAVSFFACAVSLYFQILYQNHLVDKGDWTALMDTSNAAANVSTALIIVTAVLNIITLVLYRKCGRK